MIAARKSRAFERLFDRYNSRLLRRHFAAFHVDGDYADLSAPGPILLVANHQSWWDGLALFALNRRLLQRDAFALMSEAGLREFPFFRRLGAYSIDPSRPGDIRASLRYTAGLLNNPRALVCIFPQGEEKHVQARPLAFARGIGLLLASVQRPSIRVGTLALRYDFLEHKLPEMFARFGPVHEWHAGERETGAAITCTLEAQLTQLLDGLTAQIATLDRAGRLQPPGFIDLHARSPATVRGGPP